MKKIISILLFTIFIIPSIAFASWWNPFSWNIFNFLHKKQEPKKEIIVIPSKNKKENLELQKNNFKKTNLHKKIKKSTPPALRKLINSQIIKKVKPAVVYIETPSGSGSGMIFSSNGYILTNAHVVQGYSSVNISTSNKITFTGIVVGRDEKEDLAVIKINSTNKLPMVYFGNSAKTNQGDEVFTLGFPFGIKGDVSFKEGTISRRIEKYFEISAEIHPGNSGGPLVNKYGQIIGINTATYGNSIEGFQLGETIKLAIPINIAKKLIPELKTGRNIIIETAEQKKEKRVKELEPQCEIKTQKLYKGEVSDIEQQISTSIQKFKDKMTNSEQNDNYLKSIKLSEINKYYDTLKQESIKLGEDRLRSANAISALSGGAGSSDAIINANNVKDMNSQDLKKIAAERNVAIDRVKAYYLNISSKNQYILSNYLNDINTLKQKLLDSTKIETDKYYTDCINK